MPYRARTPLSFAVALLFTLSSALCACQSLAAPAVKSDAHRCCHKTDGPAPAPQDHSGGGSCPHCQGVATASLSRENHSDAAGSPQLLNATIPCDARTMDAPLAGRMDLCDESSRPFLPAPTLLRLHCALMT